LEDKEHQVVDLKGNINERDEEISTEDNSGEKPKEKSIHEDLELPIRAILIFIGSLNDKSIRDIDPSINRTLAKTPLLLFTFGTGLLSSLSAALVKGITSQIANGEFLIILGKPLIYLLLPCTFVTLYFQINFMNLSLKYYE
jgi:hypothetical protein